MASRYRRTHPYYYANQALHTISEGVQRAGLNAAQEGARRIFDRYKGRAASALGGYALKTAKDTWQSTKRRKKPWGTWTPGNPSNTTTTPPYRRKLQNISSKRKRIEQLLGDLQDPKRTRTRGPHRKTDKYYGSATPFLDLGYRGRRRRGTLRQFLRGYRRTYN